MSLVVLFKISKTEQLCDLISLLIRQSLFFIPNSGKPVTSWNRWLPFFTLWRGINSSPRSWQASPNLWFYFVVRKWPILGVACSRLCVIYRHCNRELLLITYYEYLVQLLVCFCTDGYKFQRSSAKLSIYLLLTFSMEWYLQFLWERALPEENRVI